MARDADRSELASAPDDPQGTPRICRRPRRSQSVASHGHPEGLGEFRRVRSDGFHGAPRSRSSRRRLLGGPCVSLPSVGQFIRRHAVQARSTISLSISPSVSGSGPYFNRRPTTRLARSSSPIHCAWGHAHEGPTETSRRFIGPNGATRAHTRRVAPGHPLQKHLAKWPRSGRHRRRSCAFSGHRPHASGDDDTRCSAQSYAGIFSTMVFGGTSACWRRSVTRVST